MDKVLERLLEKLGEKGIKEWQKLEKEKREKEYNYFFFDRRMGQLLGDLNVRMGKEVFVQLVNLLCDTFEVERCEVYFIDAEVGDDGRSACCGYSMEVYRQGMQMRVLCHELAHWFADPGFKNRDEGHGDKWRACYSSIVHTLRHNFKYKDGYLVQI